MLVEVACGASTPQRVWRESLVLEADKRRKPPEVLVEEPRRARVDYLAGLQVKALGFKANTPQTSSKTVSSVLGPEVLVWCRATMAVLP